LHNKSNFLLIRLITSLREAACNKPFVYYKTISCLARRRSRGKMNFNSFKKNNFFFSSKQRRPRERKNKFFIMNVLKLEVGSEFHCCRLHLIYLLTINLPMRFNLRNFRDVNLLMLSTFMISCERENVEHRS
jgi:hypothetical protein